MQVGVNGACGVDIAMSTVAAAAGLGLSVSVLGYIRGVSRLG